jgi:hypothetical protein
MDAGTMSLRWRRPAAQRVLFPAIAPPGQGSGVCDKTGALATGENQQ